MASCAQIQKLETEIDSNSAKMDALIVVPGWWSVLNVFHQRCVDKIVSGEKIVPGTALRVVRGNEDGVCASLLCGLLRRCADPGLSLDEGLADEDVPSNAVSLSLSSAVSPSFWTPRGIRIKCTL